MTRPALKTALWTATLALAGAACLAASAASPAYRWRLPRGVAPPPVPADNPMSKAKVDLGRRLFYDADLSIDGTLSCATCHEQRRAFTEGNRTHPGVHGEPGRRNVMALANVGYFPSLTWGDPRITRLEAQAAVPVMGEHPVEMGMAGHEPALAQRLGSDPCYRRQFAAAFPRDGDRIDMAQVGKALAAFQRTLISYDSAYDRALRGGGAPVSVQARRGAALVAANCAGCHSGPNFTDGRFHNIGLYAPGAYPASDPGLKEITGRGQDEGRFRTASLRNVALTAPYMHDGSAATLPEAIRRHDGVRLKGVGVDDVVVFLGSLTDRQFVSDPRFSLPKPGCPVR